MALDNIRATITSYKAENQKGAAASLSVFRNPNMRAARLTLDVYSGEKKGPPQFSMEFDAGWLAATRRHWDNLLREPTAGDKVTAYASKWQRGDDGKGKSVRTGVVVYGLDQGMKPYIGIMLDGGTNLKFPLRTSIAYSYKDELPPDEEARIAVGGFLLNLSLGEQIIAQSLTHPAEQREGGGGGWKKNNGGGGGNYGGQRSGGGSSGGSSSNLDDDITF